MKRVFRWTNMDDEHSRHRRRHRTHRIIDNAERTIAEAKIVIALAREFLDKQKKKE